MSVKYLLLWGSFVYLWAIAYGLEFNENCQNSSECTFKYSYCSGVCLCMQGYVVRKLNALPTECHRLNSTKRVIQHVCQSSSDCQSGQEKCVRGRCSCKDGYYLKSGRCYKSGMQSSIIISSCVVIILLIAVFLVAMIRKRRMTRRQHSYPENISDRRFETSVSRECSNENGENLETRVFVSPEGDDLPPAYDEIDISKPPDYETTINTNDSSETS